MSLQKWRGPLSLCHIQVRQFELGHAAWTLCVTPGGHQDCCWVYLFSHRFSVPCPTQGDLELLLAMLDLVGSVSASEIETLGAHMGNKAGVGNCMKPQM
jgi:hypothetical protein